MKTINYILITFILGLFIQCRDSGQSSIIQGDWFSDNMIFSFEDTLCCCPFPIYTYTPYRLNNDTLIIRARTLDNKTDTIGNLTKYKIVNLQDSLLKIKLLSRGDKTYYDSEILTFKRFRKQNLLKYKKISYSSSSCFGECPILSIEIDSLNRVIFNGIHYTTLSGFYEGKITESKLRFIQNKINYLKLDSIKKVYEAPWTDDQGHKLNIVFDNNDTLSTYVFGYDTEPKELKMLINRLQTLYSDIPLNKSRIKTYHFDTDGVYKDPPPVPNQFDIDLF